MIWQDFATTPQMGAADGYVFVQTLFKLFEGRDYFVCLFSARPKTAYFPDYCVGQKLESSKYSMYSSG